MYWKRNCPAYLAKVSQAKGKIFSLGKVLFIETCLVVDSTDSWMVNSEATNHIRNSLQGFQETKSLSDREINLRLGIGVIAAVL